MTCSRTVAAAAVAVVLASAGSGMAQAPGPRPLAHISHGDVSFSVSIDPADANDLTLLVPERDAIRPPRPVKVLVRFRDETTREGLLSPGVSIGSGGYVDNQYRFDAERPITEANLFSVTVTVGTDSYDIYPW